NRLPEHRLRIRLQRVVDGEPDVFALDGRLGTDDVQGPTERVPDNDLPPVAPGERLVAGELDPCEPVVVDSREAEDVRRDRTLRISAPLLRIEAEPRQVLGLQRGC